MEFMVRCCSSCMSSRIRFKLRFAVVVFEIVLILAWLEVNDAKHQEQHFQWGGLEGRVENVASHSCMTRYLNRESDLVARCIQLPLKFMSLVDPNPFSIEHPGNIAVDDVNGGRLIFYDFGMTGSISPNIREGLLETFYGVYEKDPDKVLQSMIQMGVLVPTGDMTAVRRTSQFFLNSFEERLAAQRREKEEAKGELGFKKQLSKGVKLRGHFSVLPQSRRL